MFTDLGQHLVEIRFLLVERVDDDHFRDAVLRGVFPDRVRAHADAVLRVDDDEREIADAQRAQTFADEIRVARAINDVELLPQPFEVQQRGGDGNLPVLFAVVIIGNRRAGGDAAHAVDDAGAGEHGLAEHGFAGRSVADDGEVADVCGLIGFHKMSLCVSGGGEKYEGSMYLFRFSGLGRGF